MPTNTPNNDNIPNAASNEASKTAPKQASKKVRKKRASSRFHKRPIVNPGGSLAYQVSGMLKGVQVRRQVKSSGEADGLIEQLELEAAKSPLHDTRLTWLSNAEIAEAEASVTMINAKYPNEKFGLLKATQFFLEKFWLPSSDHTVSTAAALYMAARKSEVSPAQMQSVEVVLNRLAKAFPSEKLHELTWEKLEEWLIKDSGSKAPKTWNNVRGILGAFFAWCLVHKRKWIPENPILHIEQKDDQLKTPQIVTVAQARAIMADVEALDGGTYAAAVALMLFAGIRPDVGNGEIGRIKEELMRKGGSEDFTISDKQMFLSGKITKTGKPRWIDMPENLKAWLKAYPLTEENMNLAAFAVQRPAFRKRHNIPHDGLRHSFCSYYAKLFGPGAAALAAGHTEAMQKDRYLNASMSVEEAKEFFSIMPTRKAKA